MDTAKHYSFLWMSVGVTLVTLLISRVGSYACTIGTDCIATGAMPPKIPPAFGEAKSALSSGLFTYSKTDLSISGLLQSR
jgi:hypothetical protein